MSDPTVDMTEEEYREHLAELWLDAQLNSGCSCLSGNPPCSFCVEGFSVDLEEYLDDCMRGHIFKGMHEDYDRAMRDLF